MDFQISGSKIDVSIETNILNLEIKLKFDLKELLG